MTDDSDDLDEHRDISAQKRQRLAARTSMRFSPTRRPCSVARKSSRNPILAAPPEAWPEAAAKAQHLIQLFAAAPEAQDPASKELIARAPVDLGHS